VSVSDEPPDHDVREAVRTGLGQSAFVEAGAGTGKSTTLVSRILSIVADDSDPVPLRDVAAITFTERAGGELRNKVRDALAARSGADRSHDGLGRALLDIDVAVIGTIHSFALTILREHIVAAGLPLGFEVADGSGGAKARSRRMVEVWAERLPEEDRQHLIDAGISLVQLRQLSEQLDEMRTRIDPSTISPPELIDIEAQAHEVAAGLSGLIRQALGGCASRDDRLALHITEHVSRLADVLANADVASVIGLREQWGEIWSKAFKPGNAGGMTTWESQGGPKAVRDRIKEWEQPVRALLDAPLENALRQAVAVACDELDQQQAERVAAGELEFDDLLLLCRSLLRNKPEVRRMVARRFRIVLVDEFQDTDPVQWEIIRLVTSDPSDEDAVPQPGRLVVVGDPKQAIYSFRGADIRTYLAAQQTFPGEQYPLTTSFRSVEPIVTWVNDVFGQLFVGSPVQPEYLPLQPHHAPSSAEPTGPPVVVLRDPAAPEADPEDTEEAEGHQEPPTSRDLEPRLVASTIRQAVDDAWQITEPTPDRHRHYQRACKYRDVAVLVPSRTGVPDLLDAFDRLGIPYRSADARIVLDRPVVSGLVSALRVLNNPDDQFSLWWALKSPLFGCADDELLRYRHSGGNWRIGRVQDEGRHGVVESGLDLLARLRETWVAPQPAGVLDALVDSTRLFETLALVPRGVFDSDCVRMLQGHARSWQDGGGVGLDDYLAAVDELANNTSRATLDEPDDRDDDAVRISTIHSAKGLEFSVVALAGMSIGTPNFPEVVGVRSDGGVEINVAGVKTAGYASWKEEEREPRERAELLRLLYVACTRARDHLIVSVLGDDKARSAHIREAVLAVDALQVDTPMEAVPRTTDVSPRELDPLPDDWHEQLKRVRAASAVSWVASPSRAGASLDAHPPDEVGRAPDQTEADEPDTDSDSTDSFARRARDGRPVGRALHAALDWLFSAAGPPSEVEVDRASRRAVNEEGISGKYDDVRRRVGAAMSSALAAEAFGAQRRWTELYLAAPQQGDGVRLVEGYADLVFDTGDGLVLVDHKSDATLPADSLSHYQAQLDGYADLLRRATGRPVVRQVLLHVPGDTATVMDLTRRATN
jgi:ATP-dependent helicase/nuclease subunit A